MLQDVYNKHVHSGMMQKVKGCRFDSHRRAGQLGSSCFLADLYIWHARVDILFYQVSSFRGAFASFREPFAKIGLHFEFLMASWVSTARIQAAESTAYVKSIYFFNILHSPTNPFIWFVCLCEYVLHTGWKTEPWNKPANPSCARLKLFLLRHFKKKTFASFRRAGAEHI